MEKEIEKLVKGKYMSQSVQTLYEDQLSCIKLLPILPRLQMFIGDDLLFELLNQTQSERTNFHYMCKYIDSNPLCDINLASYPSPVDLFHRSSYLVP